MLILQFIFENFHFAVNLFAALVFFAVSWLYLDAYLETKSTKGILKVLGFSILSMSFLVNATYIEQSVLTNAFLSSSFIETVSGSTKIIGYIFLILGLLMDPIEKKPMYQNKNKAAVGIFSLQNLPNILPFILFPFFALVVFLLYLRRATIGLENHLKPLVIGFFFIFLYELLRLSKLFEDTTAISIYKIVAPFGPLWILTQVFLFIGVVIIGKWVFQYLLKRLESEIFMIFNALLLVVFLITTLSFTALLLRSLQEDAIDHLNTDANVVQYAIATKQAGTLSDAEVVSQNPQIQKGVADRDIATLKNLSTSILIAKKEAFLIILNSQGVVLARGEDNEKTGDSLSNDPLFIRAIRGEKVSSIVSKDGSISPIVSIRSAVPIGSSQSGVIGVAIVGTDIDNAFVDGLKEATKLDVSIYGGNSLSATTFVAADGKSRFVGVKEEDKNINKTVLIEGKIYSGEKDILNVPYFAVFTPLEDVSGNPVGMLFVGKEQTSVIQAASRAIEFTFIISAILILLSVIPLFFISRFITNQFK